MAIDPRLGLNTTGKINTNTSAAQKAALARQRAMEPVLGNAGTAIPKSQSMPGGPALSYTPYVPKTDPKVDPKVEPPTVQAYGTSGGGAAPAPAPAPSYSGLSSDQYRDSLLASVRAGVMTEYEANASVIRNNLAQAMASMDSELAALEPLYQGQMQTIATNQFATAEGTKEAMNQAGWNGSNSGLAIGEQTRISNVADKSRADATLAKTQSEAEINRQRTLAQQTADNSLASADTIKNEKLAGAEAEALIQSDTRNRSMYESDRNYNAQQQQFSESIRQFNANLAESRASRSVSQKAADAQAEANTSAAEKERLQAEAYAAIHRMTTQQDIQDYLNKLTQQGLPYSVMVQAQKDASDMIDRINPDGTVNNPNKQSYDWTAASN